jgi:hypothetical protein
LDVGIDLLHGFFLLDQVDQAGELLDLVELVAAIAGDVAGYTSLR